jgi:hypothetical protein
LYCVAIELHELTSVFGHELEDNVHLLRTERAPSLKLVGKRGEDDSVHATEPHRVVMLNVSRDLLIGGLIAEDGEEAALSPTNVRAEFGLEGDEGGLFIHHTYIVPELYWHLKLKVQSKTPFTPCLSYFV